MTKNKIPRRLFVTGTNTEIGKSLVSAMLMAGLRGKYWKPIQSGLEEMTDTEWIREKTGLPETHFHPETYRLRRAMSPHASAARENIRIELEAFRVPETDPSEHLIVEGAGGIMVPLNERHFMLDLMKQIAFPVLLVASSELGTINHVLLSLEQLRRNEVEIFGVVMNGPRHPSNREAIEHYGKAKVIAEINPLPAINAETLAEGFRMSF